jgi:signal transduction histidine kinase
LTDTKTIKPIPPACGDRPLLHQMWINLLSNVFKFSGKASDHTVEGAATLRVTSKCTMAPIMARVST